MRTLRLPIVAVALVGAGLLALGGIALADSGDLMRRMMGDAAYQSMLTQMQAVLGSERASQIVDACESMMAQMGSMGAMH